MPKGACRERPIRGDLDSAIEESRLSLGTLAELPLRIGEFTRAPPSRCDRRHSQALVLSHIIYPRAKRTREGDGRIMPMIPLIIAFIVGLLIIMSLVSPQPEQVTSPSAGRRPCQPPRNDSCSK